MTPRSGILRSGISGQIPGILGQIPGILGQMPGYFRPNAGYFRPNAGYFRPNTCEEIRRSPRSLILSLLNTSFFSTVSSVVEYGRLRAR